MIGEIFKAATLSGIALAFAVYLVNVLFHVLDITEIMNPVSVVIFKFAISIVSIGSVGAVSYEVWSPIF